MILNTNGYYVETNGCICKPDGSAVSTNNDNDELTITVGGVSVTKPAGWFRLLSRYKVMMPAGYEGRVKDITFNGFGRPFNSALDYNVATIEPVILATGHAVALNWSTVAVSKYGEVIDSRTGRVMYKPSHLAKGRKWYKSIRVGDERVLLHRLMLNAWVYNYDAANTPLGNHIDGIKGNNVITNLEWCGYTENMIHAVKTGLRSDNITARARHHRTLVTIEYSSIHNLCRAMGVANMSRQYFDNMTPGKLVGGCEVRVDGDNRPWYYVTGTESVVPTHARKRYELTINGVTETYYVPHEVTRGLGLSRYARWDTVLKAVAVDEGITLKITTLSSARKKYQVYCVKSNIVSECLNITDAARITGLTPGVAYKASVSPETYVYNGYAVRVARDTPWDTSFVRRDARKAAPVVVTDIETGQALTYPSHTKAAKAMGIAVKTLTRYVGLGVRYNHYLFSNVGPSGE